MNAYAPLAGDARLERDFITPEGVALRLTVAPAGARATAFAIDFAIIMGSLVVMTLLLVFTGIASLMVELVMVLWMLGLFFGRNAYFLTFELGERAATPGKRIARIRVAARDGGRLTPDAVIARNLLREVEVFLPLSFLASGVATDSVDSWTAVAGLAWAGLFLAFPLLNRDRLRCGDLVAGTWVVRDPRPQLSGALVEAGTETARLFSDSELQAYGVHELHTLEEVLRRGDPAALRTVAQAIATKIGRGPIPHSRDFLQAYYAALRAKLERELLMGRRRRDKHDV